MKSFLISKWIWGKILRKLFISLYENRYKDMVRERIFVDLPQSDMAFFQHFAQKMGWLVDKKQSLWDKYMQNSPQHINLSDEEIMEEVRAVRYGKV